MAAFECLRSVPEGVAWDSSQTQEAPVGVTGVRSKDGTNRKSSALGSTRKTRRTIAVVALIVGSGLAMHVALAQQPGTKRTDLQRHDLSARGREVVQVRVDFPPGVVAPKHSHPGEEIVYVIEGSLEYHLEGKPPVTLTAGEVLFIPDGLPHSAKNVGDTNAAELATYVVRKGKPLLVTAK